MATILLQAAGAAIGGLLGPVGSAIGAAAGALAGYAVDQALINGTRRIEGPRLTGARPFSAEEGVPLPRIYGAARVGGIVIWATRFEERRTTHRQGGKLGPKVTEYSYYGNVAFALCEGEIAGIRRVWADGREVDLTRIELRIYRGDEEQPVDPLIAAKQGDGNAPAYRGAAYVVIERFALEDYGNRIPQFQFEVLRPVGQAGSAAARGDADPRRDRIRAVAVAGEAAEAARRDRSREPPCADRGKRLFGLARRIADAVPGARTCRAGGRLVRRRSAGPAIAASARR